MPGEFYKQAIQGWHQDQYNRQQMELFRQKEITDRIKKQRANTFTRANKLFDHVVKALDGASPEQKKYVLGQFGTTLNWLGKNSPELAQALQVVDPKRMLKLKNEAFLMKNGVRPQLPADFDIEKNPAMAMSVAHKGLQWDKVFAKQVFGQDKDIQGIYDLNGKLGFRVKPDGSPELIDWEQLSMDPQLAKKLEKSGTTLHDLKNNGGVYNQQVHTLTFVDEKGEQYTELWETADSVLDGSLPPRRLVGRPKPKGGSQPSPGEPPVINDRAKNMLISFQTNKAPDGQKDPQLKQLFKSIEDPAEQLYSKWSKASVKDKKRYEMEYKLLLESKFRSVAGAGYTLVFLGPDEKGALTRDFDVFSDQFKLRPGTQVLPIYGDRTFLNTADGVGLQFIVDRANDRAYYTNGQYVGTVKMAEQLAGSKTVDEWRQSGKAK